MAQKIECKVKCIGMPMHVEVKRRGRRSPRPISSQRNISVYSVHTAERVEYMWYVRNVIKPLRRESKVSVHLFCLIATATVLATVPRLINLASGIYATKYHIPTYFDM